MNSHGRARATVVALALAGALVASLVAYWAVQKNGSASHPAADLGGVPVSPSASPSDSPSDSNGSRGHPSSAPAQLEMPELEVPTLDPRTKAEMRELVEFAGNASYAQLPSLEAMLTAEQPLVVGNAVRALGRLGLFTAGSKYAKFLDDERPKVRQESVRAMGVSGDDGAIPYLERVLASGDTALRRLAIAALGEIGGAGAIEALERVEAADAVERVFLEEARVTASKSRRQGLGDSGG